MSSPRTVPGGSVAIRLGLLHVPVTIGKGWQEQRETGLRDLCSCCNLPVDRTERCPTKGKAPEGKVKGVQKEDGTWHVLGGDQIAQIEEATKSQTLDVAEVLPVEELPMQYATGCYYVRPDKKSSGSDAAFALLAATLHQTGTGLVVKWGTTSRQRLAIIHAREGVVYLTTIPMAAEVREPGDQETDWLKQKVDPQAVSMLTDLLAAHTSDSFDHSAYEDEGLKLRSAAVDAVMKGDKPKQKKAAPKEPVTDLMATLAASVEAAKAKASA